MRDSFSVDSPYGDLQHMGKCCVRMDSSINKRSGTPDSSYPALDEPHIFFRERVRREASQGRTGIARRWRGTIRDYV